MGTSENAYERKIQLAGGTTYTVSLPKEWASEHGLEPGARVHLSPHSDGSLVVRTNGHATENADEPLTVPADERSPATLRRTLGAAYRTGADAVAVTGTDLTDAQRRTIRTTAQGLLGVDVVESTDSRVVCKSLLDASDVSVEQTLRQLQFVACSTVRDAVASLLDDGSGSVTDRQAEATRLVALLARQFERTLFDPGELDDVAGSRATMTDYYAAARRLERVATHAATVESAAQRRTASVPADLAPAIESTADEACDLVERATECLLARGDAADACELLAERDDVVETALDRALADETPGSLAVACHALAGIADCGGGVADVALRATLRRSGALSR